MSKKTPKQKPPLVVELEADVAVKDSHSPRAEVVLPGESAVEPEIIAPLRQGRVSGETLRAQLRDRRREQRLKERGY